MDLERGYHQVIVHKDSVSKIAFITPHGKWEYMRMPFGLKNAPSVFQRLMNSMLANMASFAAAYIDYVVIFSTNFEEHLNHLEAVFTRLEEGDRADPETPQKCNLAVPNCQYLGHMVGAGEVRPLQAKIEVLTQYPKPVKKKDMKAFLCLANYNRRFVLGYSSAAVQLTEARKQAPDKIEWTTRRLAVFQQLKTSLSEGSALVSPDEEKPFLLYTDTSGEGIGAVLSQVGVDGTDRPVAYYSCKLKPAETLYTVTEQVCLAVMEAVKHF